MNRPRMGYALLLLFSMATANAQEAVHVPPTELPSEEIVAASFFEDDPAAEPFVDEAVWGDDDCCDDEPADWSFAHDMTRYAYISNDGDRGFGIQDLEFSLPWRRVWWGDEWPEGMSKFHTSLDFNIHWWEGPSAPAGSPSFDLPPRVYDLSLYVNWFPRITEWLVADLAINPGLFTDFHTTPPEAFRWRGHAKGIVCLSRELHFVGGIDYINRDSVKLLPIVGLLWSPDPCTQCQFVFPHPRISRKIGRHREIEWWGYVAGEYGGGAWAMHQEAEPLDHVEYNDVRFMIGVEWIEPGERKGFIEIGYLFEREINVRSGPSFQPDDAIMVAIGWWR